jgi:hypothetical protein
VFHGHGKGVEEYEDDYEPVEPLLFDGFPNPESNFLFVYPKIRVLLELFLQC